MKILNINKFYYLKGGSETYYFALSELLKENGIDVVPFAMKGSSNLKSEYKDYFIDEIDYSDKSLKSRLSQAAKVIYSFEAKRKMAKILDDTKPDIAHLHIFQHQFSPSIISPANKRGVPIVNTVHDLKPICPNYKMLANGKVCEKCKGQKYINCFKTKCVKGSALGSLINTIEMYLHRYLGSYEKIDKFITPSMFFYNKFIEFGISKDKLEYVPNFLDADKFEPRYDNDGYLLYFGRLSEEKGIMTLLKAMKSIENQRLVIVGDGPEKDQVLKYIEQNNLKNIQCLGYKTGDELRNLVKNSICNIVPSEWYENAPYSVLESMAFGKPVIGADIGGIPELINDGISGFIFESGNVESLVDRIQKIISMGSDVEKMGQEARKLIENKFNREEHFNKITKIYGSLLNK